LTTALDGPLFYFVFDNFCGSMIFLIIMGILAVKADLKRDFEKTFCETIKNKDA